MPSVTLAASNRQFLRDLTTPFSAPGGVAVDVGDNVWVADIPAPGKLDKFGPASAENQYLSTFTLTENVTRPDSLSIENSTLRFYVTGSQTREAFRPHIEVFENSGTHFAGWENKNSFGPSAYVAVDNSVDPFDLSAGSVYVSHGDTNPEAPFGDGQPKGVEKFDAQGGPINFVNAKGESPGLPYVKGNEITGVPGESFGSEVTPSPGNLTVDDEGNIYVIDPNYNATHPGKTRSAVAEFNPEGLFIRAFTGEENPGLGGNTEGWGTGSEGLKGVAVDPVTGHVLISVTNSALGVGAVDEFDASGHFVAQITETEIESAPGVHERSHLQSAKQIAVDSAGDLYVVDSVRHAIEVYGFHRVLPTLKLAEASGRKRTEAIGNGSVDTNGEKLSDCHFETVPQAQFEADEFKSVTSEETTPCEPPAGSIPPDHEQHLVEATLLGLVSGTTYRYRLVATTEGVLGGTSESESLAFTAPAAPRVDSTFAANISSRFADLHATVAPLGADTVYHFEYSPDGISWTNAPTTDMDIGSGGQTGGADVTVFQSVGGLQPGTSYQFRVVAASEIEGKSEVTVGPEDIFRTLAPALPGLPDGRAYELVSPANKGSAEDMFGRPETVPNEFDNSDVGYPSESHDEFLLETRAAFGSFAASAQNAYVFRRGAGGWQTFPLASPSLGVQSVRPDVFDSRRFLQIGAGVDAGSEPSPEGVHDVSLLGPPGGPYTVIHSQAGSINEGSIPFVQMVGASSDLGRVVLQTTDHTILPEDEGQTVGSHALYEWHNAQFALVSLDVQDLPFECGGWVGQSQVEGSRRGAVSAEGDKIVFTAPDPYAVNRGAGCWDGASVNVPQLYMRANAETIALSAPESSWSPEGPVKPAVYAGASADGLKVFFITETELTKDDAGNNVSPARHDPELYECEMVEESGKNRCSLTRISAGESGNAVGEVATVPAISADGGAVYFTAFGRLAPGAPGVSVYPPDGHEVNLYRYDTVTSKTVYVATIDTRDYPSSTAVAWWDFGGSGASVIPNEPALAANASWYTTPDGRYLAFASASALTGYSTVQESTGDCPVYDVEESRQFGRCSEVYRYDSTEHQIACISCDPSGAAPVSDAFFGHSAGGSSPAAGPVQALSSDGSYLFFDSADALVSTDGNRTLDVYEWHNGQISLISSGRDPAPSYFLGQSPSNVEGSQVEAANVFFGTHARLVSQDTDTAGDLYDARIGGGFGTTGGVGPCEGDACQNPPSPPIDTTPGSLTFSGAGNFKGEVGPPRARKDVLANAKKLIKALKVCRRERGSRRKRCEARARKHYGVKAAKTTRPRNPTTTGRARK
jgi:hypothetical protein